MELAGISSQPFCPMPIGRAMQFSAASSGSMTDGAGATGGSSGDTSPPRLFDSESSTAELANAYVRRFVEDANAAKPLLSHDAYRLRLGTFSLKERRLTGLLKVRLRDPKEMETALKTAAATSDTFDAGLCLGNFNHDFECKMGSELFRAGVMSAQIIRMKTPPIVETLVRFAGVGAMLLSVRDLLVVDSKFANESAEALMDLYEPISYVASAAFLYGALCAYFKQGLNIKDGRKFLAYGEEMAVSGPFKYHRYPWELGSRIFAASLTLGLVVENLLSNAPQIGVCGTALAGLLTFLVATHREVLVDERAKERAFGDKFKKYMAATPRYLPDLWGMLQNAFRKRQTS